MKQNFVFGIVLKLKKFRMRRFVLKYNRDTIVTINKLKNKYKIVIINQGLYEYGYFNFTFLNNMLSSIVDVLYEGYIPIVKLKNRKDGWSDWDTFFEQPILNINKQEEFIYDKKIGVLTASFYTPFNERDLAIWTKLYMDYVRLNQLTQDYVENEIKQLIEGRKVLGVLCRGTDYITKQPFGHPIQPNLVDVISLAKTKLNELKLDFIYLATEEISIVKMFKEEFPGKVLVNKRTYYDEIFYKNNCTDIYEVQFNRDNDIYLKGLEYLSSIWILSKCEALIAGNCGGSTSALYLNNGKYKFWYLFDLGLYGVDN